MIRSLENLIVGQVCRDCTECGCSMDETNNTVEAYRVCPSWNSDTLRSYSSNGYLDWHNHGTDASDVNYYIDVFTDDGTKDRDEIIYSTKVSDTFTPFLLKLGLDFANLPQVGSNDILFSNNIPGTLNEDTISIVNKDKIVLFVDALDLTTEVNFTNATNFNANGVNTISILVEPISATKARVAHIVNGVCFNTSEANITIDSNILQDSGSIGVFSKAHNSPLIHFDRASSTHYLEVYKAINDDYANFCDNIATRLNITRCNQNQPQPNNTLDLSYLNVYDITDKNDIPINDKFHQLAPLTYKPLTDIKNLDIKYSISFTATLNRLDYVSDRDLMLAQDAFMKGCIYMATMSQQTMPENMTARNLALQGYEFALKELQKHNQENFTVLIKDKEFGDL
jgi:hypothetical protein